MIASQFGGEVSVESVYGQGSSFYFTFELPDEAEIADLPRNRVARELNPIKHWCQIKIKLNQEEEQKVEELTRLEQVKIS